MPPQQNFRIFSGGMHSGGNKDPSPYTAIKSNDIMDFLGNPNVHMVTIICVSILNIFFPLLNTVTVINMVALE